MYNSYIRIVSIFLFGVTIHAQVTMGLVGHYPLNGNANDISNYGNHGINHGADAVEDRFGQASSALNFIGNGDYVEIQETSSLQLEELSICIWVNLNTDEDNQALINKSFYADATNEQFGMEYKYDHFQAAVKRESDCLPAAGWQRIATKDRYYVGDWIFIVSTWDGITQRIYHNGVLDSSRHDVSPGSIDQCLGAPIRLGKQWSVDQSLLNGKLDDVRLYNRALSAAEIDTLYHLGDWDPNDATMTDIDGNVYETVQIGNQTWMAENLRVTHYRDGSTITNVTDSGIWGSLTTEAYSIYNNNTSNELETYGALYNWFAVADGRNLAPAGWHVPTDDDWIELEMTLGMSQSEASATGYRGTNEGSKLAGNSGLWLTGELESDGEFGSSEFSVLPGGARSSANGEYDGMGSDVSFWTATETIGIEKWYRSLYYNRTDVWRYSVGNGKDGFAIRCIKDDEVVYSGPVWHISPDGSDLAGDGSSAVPFATIQYGIESSSNGDTVLVQSGVYYESVNFLGMEIFVKGEDRQSTIIDGGGDVCVINPYRIEGFTIRNGSPGIFGNDVSNRVGTINDCIIQESQYGLDAWGSYDIINSIFRDNSGNLGAAIKWSEQGLGELNITSTAFVSNECSNYPAFYKATNNGAEVNITNCTIANNRAFQQEVLSGHDINIINSIIYHNTLDNYPHILMQGQISVSYSNLQVPYEGSGNISTDPEYLNLEGGDFSLRNTSPCIDSGDPDYDNDGSTWEIDIDDQDPDGTRMDMGAFYHHQSYFGPVWHVSTEGSDETGDGSDNSPFVSIQHAIEAANEMDTILVNSGIYTGFISWHDKTLCVKSIEGASTTILDGSTTNIYQVSNSLAKLSGFTIRNGISTGINLSSSNLVLEDLIIHDRVGTDGGGITCHSSNPLIKNTLIYDNEGDNAGGIYLSNSNPVLINVTIMNNNATGESGTIPVGTGGAIGSWFTSNPIMQNCILWNNSPEEVQVYYAGVNPFSFTTAYSIIQNGIDGITISNPDSLIWLQGNSDSNPLLLANGRLSELSPAIDSGNPDLNDDGSTWEIDIDDQDPDGTRMDLGAYYFHQLEDDSASNKIILFGRGADPIVYSYDTNLDTWTEINSFPDPTTDYYDNAMAYDIESDRIILFSRGADPTFHSYDTNTDTWTEINSFPDPTTDYYDNAMAYDYESDRIIFFGRGADPTFFSYDTNSDTWTEINSFPDPTTDYYDNALAYSGEIELRYSGPTWHVSTAGSDETGDGSLESPFASIQHGIELSSSLDTILVQPGTYNENINYSGKGIVLGSMFLTTGDQSYIQQTIIDGGEGTSAVTFDTNEDSLATLSGFTVLNGSSKGIFCENSSPSIRNCVVSQTLSHARRGIWCWTSSPVLDGVVVTGNNEIGIWIGYESHPLITNSISSYNNGSGIHCTQFSNPTLIDVTSEGNSDGAAGGGFFAGAGCNATLKRVTIKNNQAGGNGGGGIFIGNSTAFLDSVIIARNTSEAQGGGIRVSGTSSVTVNRSELSNNSSAIAGGNFFGEPGTGSYFTHCTTYMGEIYLQGHYELGTVANFDNSILWGSLIHIEPYTGVSLSYTLLQGGEDGVTGDVSGSSFSNVIDEDPLFVDTESDNYHISTNSPCIDTGDPGSPLDPDNTRADMGAYYYHQISTYEGPIWHVAIDGSDETGDGSSEYPFLSIQYADQHSVVGDTISLGPGEYLENVYFNHDTITVIGDTISASVVNGGNIESCFSVDSSFIDIFNISFTNGSVQTWPKNGSGIRYFESMGSLNNCLFYNNNSTTDGAGAGGIGVNYSSVDITNCEVYNNSAADIGGGIGYIWSSGAVSESRIYNNSSNGIDPRGGGGIAIWHSSVNIDHSLLNNNNATRGGGVWIQNISDLNILNSTITENTASVRSGGISQYDWSNNSVSIVNSIIWGNDAPANPDYGIGEPDINYSLIQWPSGMGNINSDPMFLEDYSLSYNSPAIDAGHPDLDGDGDTWDIDPDEQDPDGTRMDMGAFYFHQLPPNEVPDNYLWSTTYGSEVQDMFYDIQPTVDDALIVTGYKASDVWLLKMDQSGNIQWERIFIFGNSGIGRAVQSTSDGGFVLTGNTSETGDGALFILKTNSMGIEEWRQIYDGNISQNDIGHSIKQTTDGGYVIVGQSEINNNGSSDFWLIKTNGLGIEEWNRSWDIPGTDVAYSVKQTVDEGYIICGYTNGPAIGDDFWLIKTDVNGEEEWNRLIDMGGGSDRAQEVIQSNDGGYILAGLTGAGADGVLVKTNDQGIEDWSYYGGQFFDITQTTDGSYLATGSSGSDALMVKIDYAGNEVWNRVFDLGGLEIGHSLVNLDDAGAFVVGRTNSQGSTDGFLLRFAGTKPSVMINEPTSMSSYSIGESITIAWSTYSYSSIQNIEVQYSNNPQTPFETIGVVTGQDTTYSLLADSYTDSARIKLVATDIDGRRGSGTSSFFKIKYNGPTWHVSIDGSDDVGDGSINEPFANIQKAVQEASSGDSIQVGQGLFTEAINIQDKSLAIIGVDSTQSVIAADYIYTQSHESSMEVSFTDIRFESIVTGSHTMIWSECTNCTESDSINVEFMSVYGDGSNEKSFMVASTRSVVEVHNSQFNNFSRGNYGGVFDLERANSNATLSIFNSVFLDNNADRGGAIHLENGNSLYINQSEFTNNYATRTDFGGGAIFLSSGCRSEIRSTSFLNNSTGGSGGAFNSTESDIHFNLCSFNQNSAGGQGQALHLYGSGRSVLTRSTVGTNGSTPGSISLQAGVNFEIDNSILWGNPNFQIVVLNSAIACTVAVEYTDLMNGILGIDDQSESLILNWSDGNINSSPQFNSLDDLTLQGGSPCIDAGNPDYDSDGDTWDIDPDDQDPDGTRMDIGAFYYDQSDTIPPQIFFNFSEFAEVPKNGDTLEVTWEASDDIALDWAKLWFSSDGGQSFMLSDSMDGDIPAINWIVPDIIASNCRFAIWVSDYSGNIGADTLNWTFSIDDGTLPEISILNPSQTTSVGEYDTLHVEWEASDNIGIQHSEIFYSNQPRDGFTSIAIVPGDTSSFFSAVSSGVSDSASVKIIVTDVAGNTAEDVSGYFSITDNTQPNILSFSIPDTTEWGIGSFLDISVVATDNVEVIGLDIFYTIDAGESWSPVVVDLYPVQALPTYSWLIPDIPGDCQLQAIITDGVGLTDTSYSDIFSIIVVYPQIVENLSEIRPDGDLHIRFSQIMDSLDIPSATQVWGSVHGEYQIEGSLDGYDLIISSPAGFVSLDTIMLVLSSSAWTNSFGYGLDGNGDGIYGGDNVDNDTSYTAITAAGDFDQNGVLNFDDFDDFVFAWTNEDSEYELYPHQGDIPFINIQPDSSFDVFDLATFASMWNWAAGVSLSAPLTDQFPIEEFESEQNGNLLTILPNYDDYRASQTIVKYDPELVSISVGNDNLNKVSANGLSIVNISPDSGFIMITSSHLTGEPQEVLQLNLAPTTRHKYSLEIAVQGSDMDANVIQKRSLVELLPIPTSYSLSQNYPNPFNASTTIEYGLPSNTELNISIYDIRGRFVKEIFTGNQLAGYHFTQWNADNDQGQNVASGLYFIVLNTPEYRVARKALILK